MKQSISPTLRNSHQKASPAMSFGEDLDVVISDETINNLQNKNVKVFNDKTNC